MVSPEIIPSFIFPYLLQSLQASGKIKIISPYTGGVR
jgi:hypothetical protein